MLALAQATLGPPAGRVDLLEGYVDAAPAGPFDAATCLLTLHFLAEDERLHTLKELRGRLKPGAPLVAAFGAASGIPAANARNASEAISTRLPVLTPEEDVALLHEAGFESVELFYAGFTFKGWVAYCPGA
ncbi:hypothetical protein G6F59_015191 [Rhizopus arrhizus]|nr:hypothetical protein G6F59_015191 [Rhizopus arrhizus]